MKDNGLEDGVMTIEEIRSGIESRGTGKPYVVPLMKGILKIFQETPMLSDFIS